MIPATIGEPKIGDYLLVNGEKVSRSDAMKYVRMLCNTAKDIAGDFYEQDRSAKFRANWPIDKVFVECNWRHFIEAARRGYATVLGNEKVPEETKKRIFYAIAIWDQVAQQSPNFEGVQLEPNTQQFEGDKYENRKTIENYGKHSNTFAELALPKSRFH